MSSLSWSSWARTLPPGISLAPFGEREQGWRNVEPERPSGFKIDDQLELGRLHYRQLGGLLAFKNSAGVQPDLLPRVSKAAAIAHQATCRDVLTPTVYDW
jgi:hypothetical protein